MIKKTKDILMGKNDIQPAIPCTTVDVLGSPAPMHRLLGNYLTVKISHIIGNLSIHFRETRSLRHNDFQFILQSVENIRCKGPLLDLITEIKGRLDLQRD